MTSPSSLRPIPRGFSNIEGGEFGFSKAPALADHAHPMPCAWPLTPRQDPNKSTPPINCNGFAYDPEAKISWVLFPNGAWVEMNYLAVMDIGSTTNVKFTGTSEVK